MKIAKFQKIIIKIIKIIELHLSYDNLRIPSDNYESNENLKTHMIIKKIMNILECHQRIFKIMKI